MRKYAIITVLALVSGLFAAAQTNKLPRPSIAAGGEWYVTTGFGANIKLDIPVADGYAITTSISYDAISKASEYKNYFNIFSGIRFGDATDMYAYGALGYSHSALHDYYYYDKNSEGGLSVHAGGGYVFDSNIDIGTDVGVLTYNSSGAVLIFKVRLAYVFKLK